MALRKMDAGKWSSAFNGRAGLVFYLNLKMQIATFGLDILKTRRRAETEPCGIGGLCISVLFKALSLYSPSLTIFFLRISSYCFAIAIIKNTLLIVFCTRVCGCVPLSVFPLTAVDSLDANVISRFPFSPTRAGTKIKTSEISLNTSQC